MRPTSTRWALARDMCLVLSVVAIMLFALGERTAPAAAQQASTNPPLAQLEIDIWPEFDRQSAALVILRAELSPEVTLPAEVTLKVPASSGGPTAVATAASATSQLLTLDYATTDVQVDFITIAVTTPNRFFHVEFYEPVATETPERGVRYTWAGDFAVAQTIVQIQEPAGSSAVTVTPDLGAPEVRADRLSYREAQTGALEAGQPLTVDMSYTKAGVETSAEILGLEQVVAPADSDDDPAWQSNTVILIAGLVAAAILAGCGVYIWRQLALAGGRAYPASRQQRRREAAAGQAHCTQCGAALSEGARFCASCGAPVG